MINIFVQKEKVSFVEKNLDGSIEAIIDSQHLLWQSNHYNQEQLNSVWLKLTGEKND